MTELPKSEGKKFVKSDVDPFGTEEPTWPPTSPSNSTSSKSSASEKSDKSVDPFAVEPPSWTENTQASTRLVAREPEHDDVHEFDVDVLYSWDQSSGTISYDSAWSGSPALNLTTVGDAKKAPGPNIAAAQWAKTNQRILLGSVPQYKILSAKSLGKLNAKMRQQHDREHFSSRIVVEDTEDGSVERYELITKMCDDAISTFMASTERGNKLLEIKVHCGGDLPPRTKINGIRAERTPKYEENEDSDVFIEPIYNTKHPYQHQSTCSPALPYPSASSFGRCSIEDYVKQLKERRKRQE